MRFLKSLLSSLTIIISVVALFGLALAGVGLGMVAVVAALLVSILGMLAVVLVYSPVWLIWLCLGRPKTGLVAKTHDYLWTLFHHVAPKIKFKSR